MTWMHVEQLWSISRGRLGDWRNCQLHHGLSIFIMLCASLNLESQRVKWCLLTFNAQKLALLSFNSKEDWDVSYGNWTPSKETLAATLAKCGSTDVKRNRNNDLIRRIVGSHPIFSGSEPLLESTLLCYIRGWNPSHGIVFYRLLESPHILSS